MNSTHYLPVGTLVLALDEPDFPYEIRAVDIRVTCDGECVSYTLLDPGCDANASLECGRTLFAFEVKPYTPTSTPPCASSHHFQD